jgi:hypothetical protein
MKRIPGFLCALALAGILPAQSSWPLVAGVPFAFHVGDQAMPAGEYRVQRVAGQGMLWVIPSEPAPRRSSTPETTWQVNFRSPFVSVNW